MTYYGERPVDFYEVRKDINYIAYLSNPGELQSVGDFQGNEQEISRDYRYIGRCR